MRRAERLAFLGLGSNVGERLDHLQAAVDRLHADRGLRVEAVSSVYETAPVGGPEQEPFFNLGVRVRTRRSPRGLLRACRRVEGAGGRVRDVRWGPRTIDVDVLLYDDQVVDRRDLQVPHPRLTERAFALIPLIEVAPGQRLPDGTTLTAALAALAPVTGITMIGSQVTAPDAVHA
ncbi:MAG: 2-amino-4-hydroxy-6-hydroxymethyldihydropteridine diphosphokinase [Actinomycetota bacterium]|nr:2-amino-4-hydroxy-6-hydroxymethyldihydropteridine diphosphokinase [Actinomycetota bacterium]